ncbi:MAG: hypothetical protein V1644_02190 [Candidatus Micrarchaeota archaeon]
MASSSKNENVETVLDRFLEYVRINKKVSLVNAASALGITPVQAERIGILLEQSGFIELHYSLNEVVAVVKKSEKAEEAPKPKTVEKATSLKEVEEIEREVITAENILKFFEKDISRRVKLAEMLLEDIEKRDEIDPAELMDVEKEIDLALGQLAAFSTEVKALADMEEHFYKKLEGFKKKLTSMHVKVKPVEEISLIQKIISWIKGLLSKLKMKKAAKRIPPRKKKQYDEGAVSFLGKVPLQVKAGSSQVQIQNQKKRFLKLRTDSVKQHYWKKRRRLK